VQTAIHNYEMIDEETSILLNIRILKPNESL